MGEMFPTQAVDFRPSARGIDVVKTAEVVPRIPHIINQGLPVANTWYEIKLPPNTVTWMMRCRESADINYSYEPSQSTYMTLGAGNVLTENTVPNRGIWSVYVRCPTRAATVELELWLYA